MLSTPTDAKDEEALQLDQIDLYFNVLRLVTALAREQVLSSPATAANPVESGFDGASSAVPNSRTRPADDGTAAQPAPARPPQPRSGVRGNRVTIPSNLVDPLETFRMAATNIPIDESAVKDARHALHEAVQQAFPLDELTIKRLFENSEGSESLGGSHSVRNDCGHRFSSTDDMQTMQEVLPGLWCGSYHPATNKATLTRHGITHILSCIGVAGRFPGDFMYMSIPLFDNSDFNILPFLPRTFEFIENALIRENGGVLVHCGAGISRAPAVTAAYLMRKLRIPSQQAIRMVQIKRPYASPNAGFCRQLRVYGRQLQLPEPAGDVEESQIREGKGAALKALAMQKKPAPDSAVARQRRGDLGAAQTSADANPEVSA